MKVSSLRGLILNRIRRKSVYASSQYWDAKAEEYDETSASMWPNPHLNQLYHIEQTEILDSWLGDLNRKRVLDAGSGTGRISRHLARRGGLVIGEDFSAKAVEVARRLSPGEEYPKYVVQSFFDLEDVEEYDCITTFASLTMACQEWQQLEEVMFRFFNALKPGGVICVLEPIHRGFMSRVLDLSIDDFLATMRRTGFEIKEVKEMHFWPVRLLLAFVQWPRWLTKTLYSGGQRMLATPGFQQFGDYKAICAIRPARRSGDDERSR